jgi:hypothetical protein
MTSGHLYVIFGRYKSGTDRSAPQRSTSTNVALCSRSSALVAPPVRWSAFSQRRYISKRTATTSTSEVPSPGGRSPRWSGRVGRDRSGEVCGCAPSRRPPRGLSRRRPGQRWPARRRYARMLPPGDGVIGLRQVDEMALRLPAWWRSISGADPLSAPGPRWHPMTRTSSSDGPERYWPLVENPMRPPSHRSAHAIAVDKSLTEAAAPSNPWSLAILGR